MSAADFSSLPIGSHRFRHDCKPTSRSKPLSVTVTSERTEWICYRCGDTGSHYKAGSSAGAIRRTETKRSTLSDYGREMWAKCRELDGIALDYLRARHCFISPADGDLRYLLNLEHPSGHIGAALVALVTDAVTNEPMSLHRTWIRGDGTKANLETPRMLLQGHKKAGGVIRLWPDEAVTRGLAIAEGIETALAAAHGFTPMWSCIDAGNLAAFPVLAGIESLTIFADHDDAGLDAANKCAARWASRAEVTIVQPTRAGTDFVDEVV